MVFGICSNVYIHLCRSGTEPVSCLHRLPSIGKLYETRNHPELASLVTDPALCKPS